MTITSTMRKEKDRATALNIITPAALSMTPELDNMKLSTKGFTMIEMLLVAAITSILGLLVR